MERLTDALTVEEQSSIINALTILTNAARDLDPANNQSEKMEKFDILEEKLTVSD
jgi:hypothetical protein